MNKAYQQFLQSKIDLASVGIEQRPDHPRYFCTPKGASVFGWGRVEGLHFCFIRGFGQMVFSVNPMNEHPYYTHPLAKNFTDFLRLILACGNAEALDRVWMWEETEFEAFLLENPLTQKQKQLLDDLSEKRKLTPLKQPWAYVKALQSDFDYSKIKYTEDYNDIDMNPWAEVTIPEWKVYFDGTFWGHHGRDHAGKEIRLNKQFDWAGHHWIIPAAYACSKGIVIDFCMQAEPESIRRFLEKWNLCLENDSCENFTQEEEMQLALENPLCAHFHPHIKLNGKMLQNYHGCSVSFNPCLEDEMFHDRIMVRRIMEHYGLDPSCGWGIFRKSFLWGTRRRPEVKTLSLTMEQQLQKLPGPHFRIRASGDSVSFLNPVSNITHTLTVQELTQQTIPKNQLGSDLWICPSHCMVMSFTLSPEPELPISIFDCDEGDQPVKIQAEESPFSPASRGVCAVAVIGGTSGPAAVTMETDAHEKLHTVCSALHFQPVQSPVEWRIAFQSRQFENASFVLIKAD